MINVLLKFYISSLKISYHRFPKFYGNNMSFLSMLKYSHRSAVIRNVLRSTASYNGLVFLLDMILMTAD